MGGRCALCESPAAEVHDQRPRQRERVARDTRQFTDPRPTFSVNHNSVCCAMQWRAGVARVGCPVDVTSPPVPNTESPPLPTFVPPLFAAPLSARGAAGLRPQVLQRRRGHRWLPLGREPHLHEQDADVQRVGVLHPAAQPRGLRHGGVHPRDQRKQVGWVTQTRPGGRVGFAFSLRCVAFIALSACAMRWLLRRRCCCAVGGVICFFRGGGGGYCLCCWRWWCFRRSLCVCVRALLCVFC